MSIETFFEKEADMINGNGNIKKEYDYYFNRCNSIIKKIINNESITNKESIKIKQEFERLEKPGTFDLHKIKEEYVILQVIASKEK